MKLRYYLRGIGIGIVVSAALFISSGRSGEQAYISDDEIRERAAALGMVEGNAVLAEISKNEATPTASLEPAGETATPEAAPTAISGQAEETAAPSAADTPTPAVSSAATAAPSAKVMPAKATATAPVKATATPTPAKAAATAPVKATATPTPAKATATAPVKATATPTPAKTTATAPVTATATPAAASGERVVIVIDRGNGSDTVARKLYEAGLVKDAAEYDRWLISNGYDRRISAGTFEIPMGASETQIADIISGR